ncbi:phage terminase large subunit [Azospirillum sp. 11R-A]|uniref:phage terminase large subunit n=1 Tax=Azospirillum sp. 11R-A TaxID=3111634 RepID=UPI003C223952
MAKQDVKAADFLKRMAEVGAELRRTIEAQVDGFDQDPAASAARRKRAEGDYRFFAETYFPHHCRGVASSFHEWLFETLPWIVTRPEGIRYAIAAPRGNAKTTHVSQIFVLWCVATGRKTYPVILSDATDLAAVVLEGIKAEIEVNPRLAADFPELAGQGPTWQVGEIVTRNGAKLQARGSGKRLRGFRHGAQRPDLVVCDDLENDENVRNPELRDKLEGWIDRTVEPLGPPDGSMDLIYVGTILHHDAVLARKLKNPMWRHKIFRAILRQPDRMDLWERWEETLRNEGEAAADAFHAAHVAEMEAGTEVLWPSVQPFVRLMKIKVRIGESAFNSEYQNTVSDTNSLFGQVIFWVQPSRFWVHFGALDPSLGKESKRNDPSAILVGALDRETGILDIAHAAVRRRVPSLIIDDVIAAQKEFGCLRWGIETVQFQAFLMEELVKKSAKEMIPVPAIALTHQYSKELRIESLEPHVRNGLIRFASNQTVLLEQLRHYPNADHDDGPDALEMLWRVAFLHAASGIPRTAGPRMIAGRAGGLSDFYGG